MNDCMLFLLKNTIIGFLYRQIVKRVLFLLDPEKVHDRITTLGQKVGKCQAGRKVTAALFRYAHPSLEQEIRGIHFSNPVGLAAGFDKDALLVDIMPAVGFGFVEVGSVTGEPCAGNPKPRLWRLQKSKSLVVYYGLKNAGCEVIANRLKGRTFEIPVGISVAKTNCRKTVDEEAAIADYAKAYQAFEQIGQYYTINISCPNAFGGQPFTDKEKLARLLGRLSQLPKTKPIFVKLSPDLTNVQIDGILEVAERFGIDGFICTNLTKRRNAAIIEKNIPPHGGLSGRLVWEDSNRLIEYIYRKAGQKFVIIGCGGIFSAEDAYRKIQLGASLVQLVTGMVFMGPQLIGRINYGLVRLLRRDGYRNISDAVGSLVS